MQERQKMHNKRLVSFAKALRKNMTPQERKLWYEFLRDYPIKFLRQKIVGNYVLDFYCAKAKIAIELDGSQHYEDNGIKHDSMRTNDLNTFGIDVIRIPNNEVDVNFSGVCEYIDMTVKNRL